MKKEAIRLKFRVKHNPYNLGTLVKSNPDGISIHSEHLLPMLGVDLCVTDDKEIVKKVCQGLERLIPFGKEIRYRLCDIRGDDYEGSEKELNPALGVRGLRAFFLSRRSRSIWKAELQAIKIIDSPLISIYIPFVAKISALERFLRFLRKKHIKSEIGIMIEIPSAVLMVPQLKKIGIGFVSIGTGDLFQLFFGCERENRRIGNYFQNSYDVFAEYINKIINQCYQAKLDINLGGPLASQIDFLNRIEVKKIDSISTTIPDMLNLKKAIKQGKI